MNNEKTTARTLSLFKDYESGSNDFNGRMYFLTQRVLANLEVDLDTMTNDGFMQLEKLIRSDVLGEVRTVFNAYDTLKAKAYMFDELVLQMKENGQYTYLGSTYVYCINGVDSFKDKWEKAKELTDNG